MTNSSILCVISARGGSQGLPGKNIRPLLGKPLIVRAIETALAAPEIDSVVVSTDSLAIAEAAKAAGAQTPFLRPTDLAQADTGKFQVWQHALSTCERLFATRYQVYVDIDCTNPLIETSDVTGAIKHYDSLRTQGVGVDAVFTVSNARRNPYFNLVEPNANGALKMSKNRGGTVLARQNAPTVFEHVAGVYVLNTNYLRTASHLLEGHAEGYEIPEHKAFDVDSELDFLLIEFLLMRRLGLA